MMEFCDETRNMKSLSNYGLTIACSSLLEAGWKKVESHKANKNTVFLKSLYWYDHVYPAVLWRFVKNRHSRCILGGNTVTGNPSYLNQLGFDTFIGDGDNFTGLDDNHLIPAGEKKKVKRALAKEPKPVPYIETQHYPRLFVEISRGCPNRCLFCQYSWIKPYREIPYEKIVNHIESIPQESRNKNLKVVSADRFLHKDIKKIREYFEAQGMNDTGTDATIKRILKEPELLDVMRSGKLQTGIEGMSHRLRKSIGKDFTDDDIVNLILKIASTHHKKLEAYMIYGLPGENEADIEQLEKLLYRIDREIDKKFVLVIHWNAFTPSPQTPLQWERPCYKYPYKDRLYKLMTEYEFKKLKVAHAPKLTGDTTILKRTLPVRCSEKTARLVYNVAINQKKAERTGFRKAVFAEYKKVEGIDMMTAWPIGHPMPWDDFVDYDKEQLIKKATEFRKGLDAE